MLAKRQKKEGSHLRSCVACGQARPFEELVRLVRAPEGTVVVDWRRNLGGRGANLCISRTCLERALSKKLLCRAFKNEVIHPPLERLVDDIVQASHRQLSTLARSGCAARLVLAGTDAVLGGLSRGEVSGLLLARDFASLEKFEQIARDERLDFRVFWDKSRIGALFDRRPTGVLGLSGSQLVSSIFRVVDRLGNLDEGLTS